MKDTIKNTKIVRPSRRTLRGATLLLTLIYVLMFGALASSMVAFSQGNMAVEQAELDVNRAMSAAESGMSYLLLQVRLAGQPIISEGSIANMTTPSQIWSGTNVEGTAGNNGIAVNLASAFNSSGALSTTVIAPTGTNPLNIPAISIDPANAAPATFTLTVSWDASNPVVSGPTSYAVLHCKSVGASNTVSRAVTMDIWVQKTLKYAVYSNVAIQLGKNVRVVGDIASTYTGTNKGPPVQMFSDFHYLPNLTSMDTDLASLRGLLATYDPLFTNRLNVSNPSSPAAVAAKNAGFADLNGDGYIDDYDIALQHLDSDATSSNPTASHIVPNDYVNPTTGKPYDPDLWSLIDDPMGHVNASTGLLPNGTNPPWNGYDDNVINNLDSYAKINGSVKMALTNAQWQAAASGWQQWGDMSGGSAGTNFRDQFEGPIVGSDSTTPAVQFGVDFGSDQTLSPQDFDTSSYDSASKIPTTTAAVSGSSISNGTLTAAMANGGTVAEHSPADATSGWQATYARPVFQNMTFSNVRIPQGLNAKFINCTFNGYTSVKLNTNIVQAGTSTTTSDPNDGMNWAKQVTSGTYTSDGVKTTVNGTTVVTPLNSSNSTAFKQGNNLHFSGCNFNGVVTADVPTAYTHFADSMEFDGITNFNNTVDPTVTIMAPNTNIEMGSFQNPGANPSTLVGVVVAGNVDIRGTASVDGSLIVTGNGATNTTLGYFGSTDQGHAVPSLSQLPSSANSAYGHLFFQMNPARGMPNGIAIPVICKPQYSTYQIQ